MSSHEDLLTAQALAAALDLSVETIWRYTRENKIPHVALGSKQYRYKLSDVLGALTGSVVRENEKGYSVGADKKYTYQDYLQLPEEPGYRFEILDGILIKEPSPNVMHQRISRRLQRILEDYFWQVDPEGEVFNAPLDVTFCDITVVQPDLFYVSKKHKTVIQDARVDGPPTLVVEIASPSTQRKDRLTKLNIYQRANVQHYWLVNPDDQTLECFSLQNGVYALVATGLDEDTVEHPAFPGLSIALGTLWQK